MPVLVVPSMINRWYVVDLRAGASLVEGSRERDCVLCPMHGYVFALRTGELLTPGLLALRLLAGRQNRELLPVRVLSG